MSEDQDLYTEMVDSELARPEFASWTMRREAKHLLEVVGHLWPDTILHSKAVVMWQLACEIDDEIGGC